MQVKRGPSPDRSTGSNSKTCCNGEKGEGRGSSLTYDLSGETLFIFLSSLHFTWKGKVCTTYFRILNRYLGRDIDIFLCCDG